MTISNASVIKKLLVLFLIVAGLYYAKDFLMPMAIGAVLATLFLPFCKWLENKKLPRGISALFCLIVLLIAIAGAGSLFAYLMSELTNDIPLIKLKAIETVHRVQEYIFNHLGIPVAEQSQILLNQQATFTDIIQVIAGSLINIFTNFILILAYIFLLLYYRVHLRNFLLQLSPASQRKEMEQVIYRVTNVSQQYLLGLAKMIGCLWIMYGIGFTLVGVKNPLSFAILCGLLEIVPFIGNITGTSLTLLVSVVQGASLPMLAGIIGTYGIVQFIQGWVLEPIILGPQVKINPLFTIIALVIGELVWGIPGIFLAIPLTAMFKIVCDHIEPLKPYGFLIGEIENGKDEPGIIKKIRNWYKSRRHK